jgi:predicted CopG family antitoxin
MMQTTTITITVETKKRLAQKGEFGQSYEDIIKKLLDDWR